MADIDVPMVLIGFGGICLGIYLLVGVFYDKSGKQND